MTKEMLQVFATSENRVNYENDHLNSSLKLDLRVSRRRRVQSIVNWRAWALRPSMQIRDCRAHTTSRNVVARGLRHNTVKRRALCFCLLSVNG